MEHITCALCGGSNERVMYQAQDMRVVVCVNCGLAYMNPRPTQKEMSAFYADDYQEVRHGITTYEQAVQRQLMKNSLDTKRKLAQLFLHWIPEGACVLEVGSGWGALLKVIKEEKRARVIGLELSEMGRKVAEKHYGIEVYGETLEQWHARTGEKVDAVIVNHVLEHIYDPMPFLKCVKKMLKPSGILYLAVPNIMKPQGTPYDYYRVEHAFHFSPWSLKSMLKKAGMKIIETNLDNMDARCICVHEDDARREIDTEEWRKTYAAEIIIKVNDEYQKKYRRLGTAKKWIKSVMPKRWFKWLHKHTISILKKYKIIAY